MTCNKVALLAARFEKVAQYPEHCQESAPEVASGAQQ